MNDLLLDTNILVDFLRHHPPAIRFLSERQIKHRFLISVVSALELYDGCRNNEQLAEVDGFLRLFEIVPIEPDDSEIALAWFRRFHLSHAVGVLDCLIGAAARRLRILFFTRDLGHFALFPTLHPRQPY